MLKKVGDTLKGRQSSYGDYTTNASIAQILKEDMRYTLGWDRLSPVQKESLDLIATKIARILNGDPNHADSWHDIAGYATLVEERCKPT